MSTNLDALAVALEQPRSMAVRQCQLCETASCKLKKCTRCNAVLYCSREHQLEDLKFHKKDCKDVAKTRKNLEKETSALRTRQSYEECRGHFWGILETRAWCHANHAVIRENRHLGTILSLRTALDHALEYHRLCRSDNLGIRSDTPFIMMRLGMNQESYDFIKWWAISNPDGTYDWGDLSLPYLNVKNANIGESLTCAPELRGKSLQSELEPAHAVALCLLKFRYLCECEEYVKNSSAGTAAAATTKPAHFTETMGKEAAAALIPVLREQVDELVTWVSCKNDDGRIWKGIINSIPLLSQPPPPYSSRGDVTEAYEVVGLALDSWLETAGAIGMLKERFGDRPVYDAELPF